MNKPVGSVPKALTAKSLMGLRRKMLKANMAVGYGHNFFNFYFDTEKKVHVCWFYHNDTEVTPKTMEQIEETARELLDGAE